MFLVSIIVIALLASPAHLMQAGYDDRCDECRQPIKRGDYLRADGVNGGCWVHLRCPATVSS